METLKTTWIGGGGGGVGTTGRPRPVKAGDRLRTAWGHVWEATERDVRVGDYESCAHEDGTPIAKKASGMERIAETIDKIRATAQKCTECGTVIDVNSYFSHLRKPGFQCSEVCNWHAGLDEEMVLTRKLFETDPDVLAFLRTKADDVARGSASRWNTAEGRSETVRSEAMRDGMIGFHMRFSDEEDGRRAKHMQIAWTRGGEGKMPEATWYVRSRMRAEAMMSVGSLKPYASKNDGYVCTIGGVRICEDEP